MKVNLALALGSTTLVSSNLRGKLGGLVSAVESFGRSLAPASFAIAYAWSISPSGSASAYGLVDHNFVFLASAAVFALCGVLAWPTLTAENLMRKREDDDGDGDVGGGHSDSPAAASLSTVDGRGDRFDSTAAAHVASRETDLV